MKLVQKKNRRQLQMAALAFFYFLPVFLFLPIEGVEGRFVFKLKGRPPRVSKEVNAGGNVGTSITAPALKALFRKTLLEQVTWFVEKNCDSYKRSLEQLNQEDSDFTSKKEAIKIDANEMKEALFSFLGKKEYHSVELDFYFVQVGDDRLYLKKAIQLKEHNELYYRVVEELADERDGGIDATYLGLTVQEVYNHLIKLRGKNWIQRNPKKSFYFALTLVSLISFFSYLGWKRESRKEKIKSKKRKKNRKKIKTKRRGKKRTKTAAPIKK